ncbi:SDR family oxidoreductase [Novosphingobium sp.]|uniref:SDR family NAD(P)-dependent oxidoreductase n=1 Tax=Novosphingobium sp. TaxID=1874826 RepID=UPI002B495AAF|nr:SDR family oxidoreductase [Novosphingobium sp.]HKR91033.1 SDR family oxidoreductase [Novosphingobium sp.]
MTKTATVQDYPGLLNLEGRGFVVLGAGDGIGAEISRALAQCGARLFCVDIVEERARAIAEVVGGFYGAADVTTAEGVTTVFKAAQAKLGVIRGVVDVIGVARIKPIAEFDDDDFEWQIGIVLRHAFYTLRMISQAMPEGGPVTFVGSMSGNRVVADQVIYGTSKAALHHLVRGAAAELGPKGVRVNVIAPSFVKTPRLLELLDEAQWDAIDRKVPLGRAATPEEIAAILLFLSSDMASHVSGVVLPVDGGVSVSAALPDLTFGPASRDG